MIAKTSTDRLTMFPAGRKLGYIKLQLSQQTVCHPFEITRCQRRLLGKCLPSDTHLRQRGLQRIKHSECSNEAAKVPRSVRLVTPSRSATPHSLDAFLYSELVNTFSFPLCPRSSAAGPLRQSKQAAMSLPVSPFVCQSVVFGGQP